MKIEVFEVYNQGGVFPVRLFASKGIMEATSNFEGMANLEIVMDALHRAVLDDRFEQVDDDQAIIRYSCFQPLENGTKLLMVTALFHCEPSCIYLFLDEELEE